MAETAVTPVASLARREAAFRALAECASLTADDLFRALVRTLAETLGLRSVHLCELLDDPRRARLIAGWEGGAPLPGEEISVVDLEARASVRARLPGRA